MKVTAKRIRVTKYLLELDEEVAIILRALFQNPFTEVEDTKTAELRSQIFHELKNQMGE